MALLYYLLMSALVAQSDAHPMGDQEFVGSILAGEVDHKLFSTVMLSLPLL